ASTPIRPYCSVSTSTSRLVSRHARACSTKAGSSSMRMAQPPGAGMAGLFVAERLERGFVVGPAFAHADPGFQEDLGPEQALHLQARLGPDFLQAGAGLADHDRLLAFALDPDHRADAQQVAVFDEALDLDRG